MAKKQPKAPKNAEIRAQINRVVGKPLAEIEANPRGQHHLAASIQTLAGVRGYFNPLIGQCQPGDE